MLRILAQIFMLFMVLAPSSHAQSNPTGYPSGFESTRINFPSAVSAKVESARRWYCQTIHFIKQERLRSLPEELVSQLTAQFRFSDSLCSVEGRFVGLSGPQSAAEKIYIDFKSIEISSFAMRSVVSSLGARDEIVGGFDIIDGIVRELEPHIQAQRGVDPMSHPPIRDRVKYEWTVRADAWVQELFTSAVSR